MCTPAEWLELLSSDANGEAHLAWLDAVAVHPYKPAGSVSVPRISLNTDDADRWTSVWMAFGKNSTLVQKATWLDSFPEWEDWIHLSDSDILPSSTINCAIKAALHRDLGGFYRHIVGVDADALLEFIPAWAFVLVIDMMHTTPSDTRLHWGNAKMFASLHSILDPGVEDNTLRHAYVTSVLRSSPVLHEWSSAFTAGSRNAAARIDMLSEKFPLSTFWYALTECMFEEEDAEIQALIARWPSGVRSAWLVSTSMGEDVLLAARTAWLSEGSVAATITLPDNCF